MPRHIELNPVSHLTVGTVGVPGKRTFYVQGSKGSNVVTVVIEKEQAAILANSFESLLEELSRQYPFLATEPQEQVVMDLRLREPIEELFRVGNMGLGYSEEKDRVVLVTYELAESDESAEEIEEDAERNAVSFWATRPQIQRLIPHIREVVSAGRPICGNCGQPIDPEGHFCAHRNGHMK